MTDAENQKDEKYTGDAPRPLEYFEVEQVHPDNVLLLKERLARFQPLAPAVRFRLQREQASLLKKLNGKGYNQLCNQRWQWHERVMELAARVADIRLRVSELPAGNEKAQLMAEGARLWQSGVYSSEMRGTFHAQINEIEPTYNRYREVTTRLEVDYRQRLWRKEQLRDEKQFAREAKYLSAILKNTFRHTTGCHYVYYDKKNRRRVAIPQFHSIGVDADSIWFMLATSKKGLFGWYSLIPYGVNIADLVHEKTIENMSAACNRQVEVRRNVTGTQIYFRVNRLDSPDGLPRMITFRSMFDYYPENRHTALPYPLGVTAGRKTQWRTFSELPHILIAGSSQSGKSNEVNAILSCMISMNSPDECRLILIDNKGGVEFTHYEGVPHLIGKIIKFLPDVLPALQQCVVLMYQRLTMLEKSKCKDIAAYNRTHPESKLPRIVVVVDEMAALMDQGEITKDIHSQLRLITSMGRATGIHTILSTQYSGVDVIPGTVKVNLAVRMSGAMPSGSASMTILDSQDAKNLQRIPGRMIVQIGSDTMEVQTPYISDAEIAEAVSIASKYTSTIDPFQQTADIEAAIPVVVSPRQFWDLERVVEYCIENMEGHLSGDKLGDMLGDQSPGKEHLRKVLKPLQKLGVTYEHNGICYEVKRKGNRWFAIITQDVAASDVTDESAQAVDLEFENEGQK